jgi:D-threonate/D-erythronate kinase
MQLIVTADDATGALESAAACADVGLRTTMVSLSSTDLVGLAEESDAAEDPAEHPAEHPAALVIDLATRHVAPEVAASRIGRFVGSERFRAHKIDSTLRGNWAVEIGSIVAGGRRVLMIPAYPAAGRRCVHGQVLVDGVPAAQSALARDPRSPVVIDRPSVVLEQLVELATIDDVSRWVRFGSSMGVADARTDDDITRLVQAVIDRPEFVLVGTAAVVGAVAAAVAPRNRARLDLRTLGGSILVVSASAHPTSRAQIDALVEAGATTVGPELDPSSPMPSGVVVVSPDGSTSTDAESIVAEVGRRARVLIEAWPVENVVVLGGDTATTVLDGSPVVVDGSLGVGIASGSTVLAGRTIRVVTKPGGFGDPATLVDLMRQALDR